MKVIVKIDGKDINELTPEEKVQLANQLNSQALISAGYRAVENPKNKKKGSTKCL